MAIMLAKTYHALKAAGAPEDDAIAAAEELADYENQLTSIDNRLIDHRGAIDTIWKTVSRSDPRRGEYPPSDRRMPAFPILVDACSMSARKFTMSDLGGRDQRGGDDRDPRVLLRGHGP